MRDGGNGTPESTEVRERLLAAGLKRVARHGIRKTTLKEIARDAKCSRPTLYKHFPNKEALVQELLRREIKRHIEALRAQTRERIGSSQGSGRHRSLARTLEDAFAFSVRALRDDPVIRGVAATEPEALVDIIQRSGPELFAPATDLAAGLVRDHRTTELCNVDALLMAEVLVRLMISYAFVPNLIDEVDESCVRRLVRETVFRGILDLTPEAEEPSPV